MRGMENWDETTKGTKSLFAGTTRPNPENETRVFQKDVVGPHYTCGINSTQEIDTITYYEEAIRAREERNKALILLHKAEQRIAALEETLCRVHELVKNNQTVTVPGQNMPAMFGGNPKRSC